MKKCNTCGQIKDLSLFPADGRMRDGHWNICKACRSFQIKERYHNDPEFKRRKIETKERWYAENYVRKYGITNEQFEAMFEKQGRCCALCKSTEHGRTGMHQKSRWNIDHDHVTGRVRGILCHHCNVSLGHFERLVSQIGKSEILKYLK